MDSIGAFLPLILIFGIFQKTFSHFKNRKQVENTHLAIPFFASTVFLIRAVRLFCRLPVFSEIRDF